MSPDRVPFGRALWPLLLALFGACSGREMVLGGDPSSLTSATGGAGAGGSSTPLSGGTGGGAGAIFITGGGAGVSAGTGGAPAAAGLGNDPYPPVIYAEGMGYRTSCPAYDGTWGFTCWHHENNVSSTCGLDGTPSCNVCSCAVPCGPREECPDGRNGELSECVGSDTTVKSCFISCDEQNCPLGMTCSDYPGTNVRVCTWMEVAEGQGQPR